MEESAVSAAPTVSGGEGWEELERAVEPFALISSEGVVTAETGHVTVTTCAEYFHRAAKALALIAVARGGGALREQARSVPAGGKSQTEGLLRAALEPFAHIASHTGLPRDATVHLTTLGGQWIATIDREAFWRAQAALSQDNNRKLGGDEAQPSEPNHLPTVQAETAVVADWVAHDGGPNPVPGQVVDWLNADGDQARNLSDKVCGLGAPLGPNSAIVAYRVVQQPPVSTGEQPGMSEPFGWVWRHKAEQGQSELAWTFTDVEARARGWTNPDAWEVVPLYTSAPALPDGLLSLSEAATQGEWEVYAERIDGDKEAARNELSFQLDHTDPIGRHLYMLNAGGKCPALTGCGPTSEANAVFVAKAVNFIRTLAAKQGGKS